MNINNLNIIAFIKYLYKKKTGSDAPEQLLQSWSTLSDDEIPHHLKAMTAQWGWSEVQLQYEIEGFLQLTRHKPINPVATQTTNAINNKESIRPNPVINKMPPPIQTRSSKNWIWFILLPILLIGGYIGYKYMSYLNLEHLYSVTDNVAIRDINGETVGRMDIFASKNAMSSLRAVNETIYNIKADKDGNISESRKLLIGDASFKDYLLETKDKIVYVNKNYLTNDKEYFEIQKVVFSDINKTQVELTQLKSSIRKVIIGSLSHDNFLKTLTIQNTCNNTSKDYTSIIKHTLYDKKTMVIICQLSNKKYYKLKGNPDINSYEPPVEIQFNVPQVTTSASINNGKYLFKKVGTTYNLYDCSKANLQVEANLDPTTGDIISFTYNPIPVTDSVEVITF